MNTRTHSNLKLSVKEVPVSKSKIGIKLTEESLFKLCNAIDRQNNSRKMLELEFLEKWEREKNKDYGELRNLIPLTTRYESCGTEFKTYRCEKCGKYTITHTNSCNLRICSDCCKKQYWRIKGRYWRILEPYGYLRGKYKKYMLREITLTWERDIRLCNSKELITKRRKEINRLINHYRRKGVILGSMKVFETKRSSGDLSRIHIHAHVLVISGYISQKELSEKWKEVSGNPIVWIKLRRAEQAITYLLKHIYKPPDILPRDVPLFLEIFENRRRITTDGILFRVGDFTCDMAITSPLRCWNCGNELEIFEIKSMFMIITELVSGIG